MQTKSTLLLFLLSVFSTMAWGYGQKVRPADVKVTFITPSIVRVQWSPDGRLPDNATGVCVYSPSKVAVQETTAGGCRTLLSSVLKVSIDLKTAAITFADRKTGHVLLEETRRSAEPIVQTRTIYDDRTAHAEQTANGQVTVKQAVRTDTIGRSTRFISTFDCTGTRALYGLGSHMEDYMNLLGKTLWLTQHNLKITIPVLVSPQGYGLLFDVGCAMKYASDNHTFTMQMEAARQLDYYFIAGKRPDEVVGGYRYLTGRVEMLPRYAFGYIQSKERYTSSAELITSVREYRRRHVPLDMIVQDWNYWPQGWGYMKMDPRYYPSPKTLADTIHSLHARLMVSIWPNPQYCPEADDFRQRGYMLEHSVYNAFDKNARKLYWQYADSEFFRNGFDAWWCDSSEPFDGDWNQMPKPVNEHPYGWDDQQRRWQLNTDILSETLGAERSQLYSLNHARGLYDNQRATTDRKRVLNLTRSSWAGQQRYATVVWNGDTHASWPSFRQQIPAGLNYMATGNPYWTVDVGSFFTRDDGHRWFYKGVFPGGVNDKGYREYYVRMFQWATFLPMLRSHGSDTPREIWRFGEPGTPYYDAILRMIRLRYRLLPYIYSMAAAQTRGNYTMARPLAFDFPNDTTVLDLKDEYLFGSILVCPVTHPMTETTTRSVYLPRGCQWYDLWTHHRYEGGQWLTVAVSIDRLPLFVKAGSIIPVSDVVEYSDAQEGKPVTAMVFPGADTSFTLYHDDGISYDFKKGRYQLTRLVWNDKQGKLTVKGPTKVKWRVVK